MRVCLNYRIWKLWVKYIGCKSWFIWEISYFLCIMIRIYMYKRNFFKLPILIAIITCISIECNCCRSQQIWTPYGYNPPNFDNDATIFSTHWYLNVWFRKENDKYHRISSYYILILLQLFVKWFIKWQKIKVVKTR